VRAPEATSIATSVFRSDPRAPGSVQATTTVRPSGVTAGSCSRRAPPGAGVRSRRSSAGAFSPGTAGVVTVERSVANRCGTAGPRSWSQNRTGYASCRIAATFASERTPISRSSSASSVARGSTSEVSTATGASAATAAPSIPALRRAITRASAPSAGSSHSAAGVSSSDPLASGSGRAETNSRSPAEVKRAPRSPFVERVRRRAGVAPVGSTSQSAET
jgi:hypothetical protein